jgi:hypothetical protein
VSSTGTAGGTAGMTFIGVFTAVLLPVIIGALLAAFGLFALVYSQTQAPETNPASQEILVYGE